MKGRYFLFLFILTILLHACNPAASDSLQAKEALVTFFDALHEGRYAEASAFYAGTYETMIDHNPGIDPDDRIALWQNACTINGAQCLPVRSAAFQEKTGDDYLFLVEFEKPDGTLFVLGPCCGGNETEIPPVSRFEYRVQELADGTYVVLDAPVYVP